MNVKKYWKTKAAKNVNTFALFGDDPFLIHKKYGEGQVILWTTSVNHSWTRFPFTQDYLPLMQNLIVALSATVLPPLNLKQGETLLYSTHRPLSGVKSARQITQEISGSSSKCTITLPDGQKHEIDLRVEGDEWLADWSDTQQPGLYVLSADNLQTRYFSVSLDQREGNFEALNDKKVAEVNDWLNISFMKNYNDLSKVIKSEEGVKEWWRIIVFFIIVLLCIEMVIAWRFSS